MYTTVKVGKRVFSIADLQFTWFHHLHWSLFLWLEYVKFEGIETALDAKCNLIQVPVVLYQIFPIYV